MKNEELVKAINSLPTEAKIQIERFIERLRKAKEPLTETYNKKPLREEPFVGMWADRDDMKDSTAWVRATRRTQFLHDR